MIRNYVILTAISMILHIAPGYSQKSLHFYDVDKEIKIEGAIQKIVMEARYADKTPFLILVVSDKKTGNAYNVEISPVWFFSQDFHAGEFLRITGSTYEEGKVRHLIARQIQFKGKRLELRDKNGFPNWRGGPGKRQGIRKRKKF